MARQRLGQHFLTSQPALQRIASAACGTHAGTAIEIGPGRGALTRVLLPLVDRLFAIEIDPDLAAALRSEFAAEPKLTVLEGDALDFDFASFQPAVICGNLPYYVATPILQRAVRSQVRTVALIQKEVADRLAAQPGSRDFGFLTCEVALYAQARYLFTVKPGSFRPPPNVESAVVSLAPHPRAQELNVDPQPFLKFLAACFQHKRKTLRNNLRGLYAIGLLEPVLEKMGRSSMRAEQCSLDELAELFRALAAGP